MPQANVFVVGLDETNLEVLQALPEARDVRFHRLFEAEPLLDLERLDVAARLAEAERILRDFDGTVDAVVGYWDFPVSSMVPILCRRLGLPGPELEGVLRCEHKYWSRLEQAEVIDEYPAFGLVSLDDEDPVPPRGVTFPMWLKPVKSVSSQLAFRAENEQDFRNAVASIGEDIDTFSDPFDRMLEHAQLPPEIAEVGSRACLAEEAATGRQLTVEGYCVDDDPHVYGVVETVLYPETSNFQRYEYPAPLPPEVTDRLTGLSERVMRRMGIGSGTFNVEWFWDADTDRVRLLEINPRHSQSHAEIFQLVDGVTNHRAMLQIGLGRDARVQQRQGDHTVAAKFFLREFHDAVVTRAPGPDRIAQVERDIPGVTVDFVVEKGTRLSELPHQDPYSYVVADIVVGADNQHELLARYDRCVAALDLGFEWIPDDDA